MENLAMRSSPQAIWLTAGRALENYLKLVNGSHAKASSHGWIALSGVALPETNMAYIAHLPDSTRDSLTSMLSRFTQRARQHSTPLLLLLPQAVLGVLGEEVATMGISPAGAIPLMTLDTTNPAEPSATSYEISRVTDRIELERCCAVIAEAFELPEPAIRAFIPDDVLTTVHSGLFVTRLDGIPVCTVLASWLGATVGLRFMATAPHHQGKGARRAMLDFVIHHYATHGVETVYLGTTEAGFPLYTRAGFEVIEETPLWISLP